MGDMRDRSSKHRRPIRSFVRRAGRLTPSQLRALDELWPQWGIPCAETVLDLDTVFGRRALRTLEIGFGNGESLVRQAQESPQRDFIGIEVHEPGIGHCLLAIRDAGINNLRLIAHDAVDVLRHQVPPESLHRINLYFPDPWPKKRHHKRRIVQPPFIELCAGCLVPGGSLHIATDWADYAAHVDEVIAASSHFVCAERREHAGDAPLDRPATKFERRGLDLGHRIWDWRFERV